MMRLLILGALGPYPERILRLTEQGHQLWYAHTELPSHDLPPHIPSFPAMRRATGGPEPDIQRILAVISEQRVHAVYSLLNVWDGSNLVTAALLRAGCPVPVIRHYKEHYLDPSDDERTCIERSAGVIFINEESRAYFSRTYRLPSRTTCLDADLIPARYLDGPRQQPLSRGDARPHILIAGSATNDGGRYDYRQMIEELTGLGAHVHLYGQFRALQATGQLGADADVEASYRAIATRGGLRIHRPIPPRRFVEEWSRYDAGLLHASRSDDRFRALNMPNRYSAYLAAGLPVGLIDGDMPAMQRCLAPTAATVVAADLPALVRSLPDYEARDQAWSVRRSFTFDATVPHLVEFIASCCTRESS